MLRTSVVRTRAAQSGELNTRFVGRASSCVVFAAAAAHNRVVGEVLGGMAKWILSFGPKWRSKEETRCHRTQDGVTGFDAGRRAAVAARAYVNVNRMRTDDIRGRVRWYDELVSVRPDLENGSGAAGCWRYRKRQGQVTADDRGCMRGRWHGLLGLVVALDMACQAGSGSNGGIPPTSQEATTNASDSPDGGDAVGNGGPGPGGSDGDGETPTSGAGFESGTGGDSGTSEGGSVENAQCDPWDPEAGPDGFKCQPYKPPGTSGWYGSRCSPLQPPLAAAGELCWRDYAQDIDNCDLSSICFYYDITIADQVKPGVCAPRCWGTPSTPQCHGSAVCNQFHGNGWCIDTCNPLIPDSCGSNRVCAAYETWLCVAEHAETFDYWEPCVEAKQCLPGSGCFTSPACLGTGRCCHPGCDVSEPGACGEWGVDGLVCTATNPDTPGLEDAGLCAIPT